TSRSPQSRSGRASKRCRYSNGLWAESIDAGLRKHLTPRESAFHFRTARFIWARQARRFNLSSKGVTARPRRATDVTAGRVGDGLPFPFFGKRVQWAALFL